MSTDLKAMRLIARAARNDLSAAHRADANAAIAARAMSLVSETGAVCVSSYLTTDGEPNLGELHDWCQETGVSVVVPVMARGRELEFRLLTDQTLTVNSDGIPEPKDAPLVLLSDIQIVFAPLVVFDKECNRAGRGGGWYDRALAARTSNQTLVGVSYESQYVPEVPVHSNDVPLDRVITETSEYTREK